ncbi:hypothetical protein C7N43_01725 [Sphingobacteriales bacterium UPWRP_1]|nr:hypothetical protein B6N25_15070 [Sphingobacteriales bacterium TSM_CSS]PSJ78745.1 hypothetical protein C7N43_01725 [Sphingobacteriales bacterium UPWRP_1]
MECKFIFGAVVFFATFVTAQAQPPAVNVSPSTGAMQIGDALILTLDATCTSDIHFDWPQIPDTLGGFEVTGVLPPDTVKTPEGTLHITQKINLTAFDAGTLALPPLNFNYRNTQTGSGGSIRSTPVVVTVREPEVDTTAEIKDIAPPVDLPLTLWERLRPYVIALCVILLLALLWWWWKKRSQKQQEKQAMPQAPPQPPYEVALNRLKTLEQAKYWQQGQEKQYYSELTDILRQYIEGRYQIQAPEMTTDETVAAFKHIAIEGSLLDKLRKLLELADLVKFAKAKPLVEEHLQAFTDANYFVRATKPVEEAPLQNTENPI